VQVGLSLPVTAANARAAARQAEYSRGTAADNVEDLTTQLNEILGVPLDAKVELEVPRLTRADSSSLAELTERALSTKGDVIAAEARLEQAHRGVSLARAEYLPDITLIATQTYQDAVAFYPRNSNSFGIKASLTGFDFGKRRATVREREASVTAAAEDARRVRDHVASEVERAYRKARRAEEGLEVARALLDARTDAERIAGNQSTTGMTLVSATQDAVASRAEAQAQVIEAELGVMLARAELARAVGRSVTAP